MIRNIFGAGAIVNDVYSTNNMEINLMRTAALIICLFGINTIVSASLCSIEYGDDWVKQYNSCPTSPTAAYNAIVQLYARGNKDQAKRLLIDNLDKFDSFDPLEQLSKEMSRWSNDPYMLISKLTESSLNTWVDNLPPPAAFDGELPKREEMPPLPELVKDEFETTDQFKTRVANAKLKRQKIRDLIEARYQSSVKNYNNQVSQYNRKLEKDKRERPKKILAKQNELLAGNIKLVLGEPMLKELSYNADEGVFFARLISSHGNFDLPIKFSVPLSKARSLKQESAQITPEVEFTVENNRLNVKNISIPHKNYPYQAELTSHVNTSLVLTAQLDDTQLKTAYTNLNTIKPQKASVTDDNAFFNTALSLVADPELALLKQQQAELERKQEEVKQQKALENERERLKQIITHQQQALASLGGGLATQYKGLLPVIDWSFDPGYSNKNTVMVIIGNRNYRKGVPLVHYAHNDAKAMREFARQGLGLNPEDIIYEEDATKGVMEGVFKSTLPSLVRSGKTNVIVYFSGHGMASNNDASLLPVDSRPNTASVTGYSRNALMTQLGNLGVNTVVILDACYTGTSKDGMPLLAAKPVFKSPKQAWIPKNVTLISAASADQIAWMYDSKGLSLMTYYLLKGVQGEADKNRNGEVDSHELSSYLKTTVNRAALALHEQQQHPEVLGMSQILVSRL